MTDKHDAPLITKEEIDKAIKEGEESLKKLKGTTPHIKNLRRSPWRQKRKYR